MGTSIQYVLNKQMSRQSKYLLKLGELRTLKLRELRELMTKEDMSERTYNICHKNQLFSAYDILNYHKTYKTFKGLRNCGDKSELELVKICLKYRQRELRELRTKEDMSERTYNICSENQLFSASDILDYHKTYRTFKSLRNCGDKSEHELVKICLKYRQYESSEINENNVQESKMQMIFKSIKEDHLKWQYAHSEGNTQFAGLSVRAKNSVYTILGNIKFDLEKFIIKAILISYNFGEIKSAGKKTIKELTRFSEDLKNILIDLDAKSFNELDFLIKELERTLDLNLEKDEELIESFKTRQLNIIHFFDNYVLDSSLCSKIDKKLIIHLLQKGEQINNKGLFNTIANKQKLSNERVRQLSVKLENNFPEKFNFLPKLFDYSYDLSYNIYKNKFWIIKSQIEEKNKQERFENSPNTLGNILGHFGGENFYSLTRSLKLKGTIGAYNQDKYKRYRSFRIPCIIHHDFLSKNTITRILNTVYSKLYRKIKKDLAYKFDEFGLNDEQLRFVTEIVSNNFDLQEAIGGGVLLKRNTKITSPEIIETILIEQDDLMSAEEICLEFNRQFPKKNKPVTSIRSALQGEKFIYLRGRISLYGLKDWEEERGLKTGNIKNICLEFLENNDEPVHIYAICKHILKFRNTTSKNILTNLSIDPFNTFIIFDASYIGLTSKKYPESIISSYNSIAPSDANQLCTFIKNHLYYDIKKVVSKFSRDFNLKEIQIEYIINQKCKEGILKVKNNRVYYAMSEEDLFIKRLFKNYDKLKISGFNPYRIGLNKKKVMCRLILYNETKFIAKKQLFEFSSYDSNQTDFKSLFIYQKNLKSITSFIWSSKEEILAIVNNQYYLSEKPEVSFERLNGSVYKLSFSEENINNFVLNFENIINGNPNKQDVDVSIYNIIGMNKLEAIAHIIDVTEQNTGVAIDLVEAKKYFNLIQMKNSIR